ncbi:MAG: FRG domain-containing protein [Candidatus Caccosoma sp.]|nr:FRG domain-containing protein [Candidatus Caccosoma sp.]
MEQNANTKNNTNLKYTIIESLDDYFSFLKKIKINNEKEGYYFRGIKEEKNLKSSLYIRKLQKSEDKLIQKFEENCSIRLPQYSNILDFLAVGRHYGLPSRLIDWTRSPLVATLFALHEKSPNYLYNGEKYYAVAYVEKKRCIKLRAMPFDGKYLTSKISLCSISAYNMFSEIITSRIIIKKSNKYIDFKNVINDLKKIKD